MPPISLVGGLFDLTLRRRESVPLVGGFFAVECYYGVGALPEAYWDYFFDTVVAVCFCFGELCCALNEFLTVLGSAVSS